MSAAARPADRAALRAPHAAHADFTNVAVTAHYAVVAREPAAAPQAALNMLRRMVETFRATHLVLAIDPAGGSFRRRRSPAYKAGRTTDSRAIVERALPLVAAAGIPVVEVPDYEADDTLAGLATVVRRYMPVSFFTSDRDLAQCVRDATETEAGVQLVRLGKQGAYDVWDVPFVCAYYDVARPDIVPDLKGIIGEAGDGIVGIRRFRREIATRILRRFTPLAGEQGSPLDAALAMIGSVGRKDDLQKLVGHEDAVRLARDLATLCADLPLPALDLRTARVTRFDWTPQLAAAA